MTFWVQKGKRYFTLRSLSNALLSATIDIEWLRTGHCRKRDALKLAAEEIAAFVEQSWFSGGMLYFVDPSVAEGVRLHLKQPRLNNLRIARYLMLQAHTLYQLAELGVPTERTLMRALEFLLNLHRELLLEHQRVHRRHQLARYAA